MFTKTGLKTRLLVAFTAVSVSFLLILIIAGQGISRLEQDVRGINETTLPNALLADEMNLSRSDVQQFLTDVSATHDPDGFKEAELAAQRFLAAVEKFRQHYQQEGNTDSLTEIAAIESGFNNLYAVGKVMANAYINEGIEAGNVLMKGTDTAPGFDQASEALMVRLDAFRQRQVDEAGRMSAQAEKTADVTLAEMLVGGVVATLLAVFAATWIVRSITRPLRAAAKLAHSVADGGVRISVCEARIDFSTVAVAEGPFRP